MIFLPTTNALLAQVIGGCFTGLLGFLIPSEYEKRQSFENKIKVWGYRKSKNSSFFMILCKIVIGLFIIGFVNIQIAKYFDAFPMSKTGASTLTLSVVTLVTLFLTKSLRYLYFKSKVN